MGVSDFEWPAGHTSAACITFDVDADAGWLGADPANAARPGLLSQGLYGVRVAVPLILDLLQRFDVRATFFVPGVIAEREEAVIRGIVERGHEIALHGYTHRAPARLSPEEEAEEVERASAACRKVYPEVIGYRSPSWDISPSTLGLLASHGVRYTSQFMDRLVPYMHSGLEMVELPVQWLLDDWPQFVWPSPPNGGGMRPPSAVYEMWSEEFEGIHELGGLYVLTMHPQVIGRPSRLRMLARLLDKITSTDGVWLTTCREVSDHAHAHYRGHAG